MAITDEMLSQLGHPFTVLLPHLNERQRRLAVAAEARLLGHGGVRAAARAAAVSETTVRRGIAELESGVGPLPGGRIRAEGGGRKLVEELDPGLVNALMALVEPDERGDPESPLRWTTKSLRHLAEELAWQGHPVSAPTVGRLLKRAGFSLQGNAKTLEGTQHPDRNAQIESTFATVRLRTKVTRGAGSRAAALAMVFKLVESAQARWRAVNAPHIVALVRAGARFERGVLVERDPAVAA